MATTWVGVFFFEDGEYILADGILRILMGGMI